MDDSGALTDSKNGALRVHPKLCVKQTIVIRMASNPKPNRTIGAVSR